MSRFAYVLGLCFALVGCGKQGAGERCQINDDCDYPAFACSTAGICTAVGITFDAGVLDSPPAAFDSRPPSDAPVVVDVPAVVADAPDTTDAPEADAP
jgi:hypothetical protein